MNATWNRYADPGLVMMDGGVARESGVACQDLTPSMKVLNSLVSGMKGPPLWEVRLAFFESARALSG